jgi:hypothetical protein
VADLVVIFEIVEWLGGGRGRFCAESRGISFATTDKSVDRIYALEDRPAMHDALRSQADRAPRALDQPAPSSAAATASWTALGLAAVAVSLAVPILVSLWREWRYQRQVERSDAYIQNCLARNRRG